MKLEHKFASHAPDVTVTDGTTISGYASIFGSADQSGDQVQPGAFSRSLEKTRSIKMLWQHDPAQPIGVWEEIKQDDHGLWVKGRLLIDVAKGREAASLVAAGAIDGLSIGYRTVKAQRAETGGRKLEEIDLWEISLVTFPMLADARVGHKFGDPMDEKMRSLAQAFETARTMMGRV